MSWVKVNNFSGISNIFRQHWSEGHWMRFYNQGMLHFHLSGISNSNDFQTNFNTNQWYHVAGTYDGSEIKLYVNGNLDSQISASGSLIEYEEPFYLGAGNQDLEFLNGNIEEASVWSKSLTQEEIQNYMNCPPIGDCLLYTSRAHET